MSYLEYRYRFPIKGKKPAITVVIAEASEWPIRTLRAKGYLSMMHFASRKMNELDFKEIEGSRRYHSYIYRTWEDLFKDECRLESGEKFLNELQKFSNTHPLHDDGQREAFNTDSPFALLENETELIQITR